MRTLFMLYLGKVLGLFVENSTYKVGFKEICFNFFISILYTHTRPQNMTLQVFRIGAQLVKNMSANSSLQCSKNEIK